MTVYRPTLHWSACAIAYAARAGRGVARRVVRDAEPRAQPDRRPQHVRPQPRPTAQRSRPIHRTSSSARSTSRTTTRHRSTGRPARRQRSGLDKSFLNAAAENAALSADVQSLLVVRHGKLVFERYFNGSDAGRAHSIASASKSILSVATGIAIDDGMLELDTRIDAFLPPDLVGAHGDLTIENLLTMSGGLAMSEDPVYVADVGPKRRAGRAVFRARRPQAGERRAGRLEVRLQHRPDPGPGGGAHRSHGVSPLCCLRHGSSARPARHRCRAMVGRAGRLLRRRALGLHHAARVGALRAARAPARNVGWASSSSPTAWLDESLAQRWDLGSSAGFGAHQGYGFLWWLYDSRAIASGTPRATAARTCGSRPDLDLLIVTTQRSGRRSANPDHHEIAPGAVARAAIFATSEAPRPPGCRPVRAAGATPCNLTAATDPPSPEWPVGGVPALLAARRLSPRPPARPARPQPEIYTVASDGTALTRLTRDLAPDILPAFSPDGSSVAFARGDPSTSDLYLVDADGGYPTRADRLRRLRALADLVSRRNADRLRLGPR